MFSLTTEKKKYFVYLKRMKILNYTMIF